MLRLRDGFRKVLRKKIVKKDQRYTSQKGVFPKSEPK